MQRHEVQLRGAESWGGGGWGRTASAPPCGRVRVVWQRCPVPARPAGAIENAGAFSFRETEAQRHPYGRLRALAGAIGSPLRVFINRFNGLRIYSLEALTPTAPNQDRAWTISMLTPSGAAT